MSAALDLFCLSVLQGKGRDPGEKATTSLFISMIYYMLTWTEFSEKALVFGLKLIFLASFYTSGAKLPIGWCFAFAFINISW